MNRHKTLGSIMAAGVATLAFAALSPAQQTGKPEAAQVPGVEMKAIQEAIANPRPATVQVVLMQFTGTFDDLPRRFEEFTKAFEEQGFSKQKLASNPTGVYVVYEDPEGKSTYRLGVGVQVPSKLDVKEPLRAETLQTKTAVRVTHEGPYKNLGNVRNAVVRASEGAGAKALAGRKSGFPIVARLLNDPRKIPENRRRTELIIPF
jgi:hypothetical protein